MFWSGIGPSTPAFWSGIESGVRDSATSAQLHNRKAQCLVPGLNLSAAQPSCRKALSLLPEEARLGVLGNLGALLMSAGHLSDSLKVIEDSILVGEKYGHEDSHQVGPASMLPPVTRRTSQDNIYTRDTSRPPGRLASAVLQPAAAGSTVPWHLPEPCSAMAQCCLQQQAGADKWHKRILAWGQAAHGTVAMMADMALRHSSSWQMFDLLNRAIGSL